MRELFTWLNGLPVGAKLLVGFPALVTAFLLAQSAGLVPSLAARNYDMLAENQRLLMAHQVRTDAMMDRIATGLRVICQNAAKGEAERRNCENIH